MELKPGFERAESGLAAVKKAIEEEETAEQTTGTHGVKKAKEIVQRAKTSSLAEEMSSMGPADFTVVRARLRFPISSSTDGPPTESQGVPGTAQRDR